MNKRGHVLNAALLSVGIGYILEPAGTEETFATIVAVGVPVVLGALFPDVDTAFGKHRKTLHNLPILAGFLVFPYVFGNLEYVWIGITTHYALDVIGTTRGIALFYPVWKKEFNLPIGVPVGSKYSDAVTVGVTAIELAAAGVFVYRVSEGLELGRQALGV